MKVIKLFQFDRYTVPTKNEVLKIQICDNRYGATTIYGYFDERLYGFYYTSMCGDCLCREYIDKFEIVSWEYKY